MGYRLLYAFLKMPSLIILVICTMLHNQYLLITMSICNERGVFNVCLFGWSTGWLTVYEVSLVLGQPTWPRPRALDTLPIPQRRQPRRAHMVTHLCSGVPPTLGYHSQRGRAYTSYTENSVWPHFESILPGVPPPSQVPPPKHTTPHPPTLTPHITHPHPSSKRLEKWEMFSLQPSHYQCTHPS